MSVFQLVFAGLFALALLRTVILFTRGLLPPRSGFLWSAVWLVAIALVLNPGWSLRIARFFGIGRGVDFVMYVSIVAGAFVCFGLYMRTRRLERVLTDLARHVALAEAERGSKPEPAPGRVS